MAALVVEELGVFGLTNGCLDRVDSLFDKDTVLNVENTVGIALKFGVVRDHDKSGTGVISFALGTYSVDVEEKVHDRDCRARVQVTSGLI